MELLTIVGSMAGMAAILAYIPQIQKSRKLKSMNDVSMMLLLLFTSSSLLWAIYGYYNLDYVLGGLSTITFLLGFLLIIMKIIYEKKHLHFFKITNWQIGNTCKNCKKIIFKSKDQCGHSYFGERKIHFEKIHQIKTQQRLRNFLNNQR